MRPEELRRQLSAAEELNVALAKCELVFMRANPVTEGCCVRIPNTLASLHYAERALWIVENTARWPIRSAPLRLRVRAVQELDALLELVQTDVTRLLAATKQARAFAKEICW
jgi:hypothetical protein